MATLLSASLVQDVVGMRSTYEAPKTRFCMRCMTWVFWGPDTQYVAYVTEVSTGGGTFGVVAARGSSMFWFSRLFPGEWHRAGALTHASWYFIRRGSQTGRSLFCCWENLGV